MLRTTHHPKAYLEFRRNVQRGLRVRTQILLNLEKTVLTARRLAEGMQSSYPSVLHHLHLLEAEGVITRKGPNARPKDKKPYFWELTGAGQQRLPS